MAAGNVARIIREPGRIVVNPTIPGGAYPYGGVEIGKSNRCALLSQGTPFRVEYESLGEVGDVLEANKRYAFSCFLRGWDDDAVEQCLAGSYEAGSVSQHATFTEPGTRVPGSSALTRSVVLVYVPDDPINVPGLVIYRGIPDLIDGAELALQRGSELGIEMGVECLRDTSGRIFKFGRLADLQLGAPSIGTMAATMLVPTVDTWVGTSTA